MSAVAQLAKDVRRSYVHHRSAFDSIKMNKLVHYRVPARYDGTGGVFIDGEQIEKPVMPIWTKLAREFISRCVNYEDYIAFCFSRATLFNLSPEPNHLLSDKYWQEWISSKDKLLDDFTVALGTQLDNFTTAVTYHQRFLGKKPNDSYAAVLTDGSIDLGTLFRYCVASGIRGTRFRQIEQSLVVGAVIDYLQYRRSYDRTWKQLIPAKLTTHADAWYAGFYGEHHETQE